MAVNVLAISSRPLDGLGGAERSLGRLCRALAQFCPLQIALIPAAGQPERAGPQAADDERDWPNIELPVDVIYLGDNFCLKNTQWLRMLKQKFPQAKFIFKETTIGKLIRILQRLPSIDAVFCLQTLDAIVCTSWRIQQTFQALDGYHGHLLRIPNGVDTRVFAPLDPESKRQLRMRLGLPADRPVVLFSGRFAEKKNLDIIYGAWLDMEKRLGDWGQLVLVGKVHKHYDEGIVRLMREDLRTVRFAGPYSLDEELAPWYQVSDFFLAPTSREGLSNAFLEACACGLYPVVTASSGYEDVLASPDLGMLVEERNTSDVIRCLEALRADPPEYQRRGRENLRPLMEKSYDIQVVARLYLRFLTEICAPRGSA
jgi:glycosyltransferase involved in cell wall biosynthesis